MHDIPIKPYTLKLDKVSVFRYKKILSSLRMQCKSEDIVIKKERISWCGFFHPFTVQIFITGVCPIPESDLIAFRKYYDDKRKEGISKTREKKARK